MPVLVVGAERVVGRAAVAALARAGGEVRAFADAATARPEVLAALRGLGARVAVGAPDDEAHLEAALTDAHTVVHLAGGPLAEPAAHLEAAAATVLAAETAGCRRLVLASELAAGEPAGVAYLEAVAEAEALVADSPLEGVVLRCALRVGRGEPLAAALGAAALPPEVAEARHAPVFVDDVAAAIAAADAARGDRPAADVVVELVGPDVVALGALAAPQGAGRSRWRRRSASTGGADGPVAVLPLELHGWLARPGRGGPGALGRGGTPLAAALVAPAWPPVTG
ncbi:MAG: NAD(P)H-binding protein [Egibacteraceae bacterium]